MELPNFENNGNLPAGIYLATWQEIEAKLAFIVISIKGETLGNAIRPNNLI